jgi:hypothetical protein
MALTGSKAKARKSKRATKEAQQRLQGDLRRSSSLSTEKSHQSLCGTLWTLHQKHQISRRTLQAWQSLCQEMTQQKHDQTTTMADSEWEEQPKKKKAMKKLALVKPDTRSASQQFRNQTRTKQKPCSAC